MIMNERETTEQLVDTLKCTVCRRQRHTLRPRQSRLNKNMRMLLCNECFDGKLEPRFLIVMIAREERLGGMRAVKDYIRNRKYFGPQIKAEEVIPKD